MKIEQMEFIQDSLRGDAVINKTTRVEDLKNVFANEELRAKMSQKDVVYEVQAYFPVEEGTFGGLFFGITKIYPGKVGDEYYMTRGHFHAISDRAEYYWGIQGFGMLILMDRNRKTRIEKMYPGSLHYIPAHTAHRVANAGDELLSFGACWPSDAGHDYREIAEKGFSARLLSINNLPQLVDEAQNSL